MAARTGRIGLIAGALALGTVVWAADPLGQLGVPAKEAQEQLMSAITVGNNPYGGGLRAFKKLAPDMRGAVAADLFAWAKTTTNSAAFKSAYASYRNSQKPEAPTAEGTVEQEFQKRVAKQGADFAESRKVIATLPADQRKAMEESVRQAEVMMKSPDMVAALRAGIQQERDSQQESFTQSTADWRERYPENPAPLIARQLHRILDASADVDFTARLVSRNGAMVFVNDAYEQKPGDWKLCYRAGKEAVGAARSAAAQWLKELGM